MLKLINHSFFNHKGGEWGTWNLSRARFPEGGVYAGEGVSNLKHRCHDRKCRIKKIPINILLAVRFLVFYVLT